MFWPKKNRTRKTQKDSRPNNSKNSSLNSKPFPYKPEENHDRPAIPPDAGFVYYEGK